MQIKEDDIDKLILDYLDGSITSERLAILRKWLMTEANRNELHDINDIYLTSSLLSPHSDFDAHEAWAELKQKCISEQNKKQNNIQFIRRALKVAAFVAVIISTAIFSYRYFDTKTTPNSYSEYNVPRGSRSHIYLPDGTSVWLNAQSTLKYSQKFGQENREVILEGEAYFDVVRNENSPFLVKARDAVVRVLGTKFNVKAYPEENFIETTVVNGRVQVKSPGINNEGQDEITLTANQKVKIIRNEKPVEYSGTTNSTDSINTPLEKAITISENKVTFSPKIEAQVYTSWKDDQWIIERETLKELAIKIERRYNIQVKFNDSELEQYVFSGKLKDESLGQLLEALSVAAPIDYTINQKSIVLYKKQKFKKK